MSKEKELIKYWDDYKEIKYYNSKIDYCENKNKHSKYNPITIVTTNNPLNLFFCRKCRLKIKNKSYSDIINNKRFCKHCDGVLVKVGYDRLNGKDHEDWNEREYHKKCWKELNE